MQSLVTRGRQYAEAAFAEARHVDVTALIETQDEIITLSIPSSSVEADEDTKLTFRKAVEEVVASSKTRSVIIIAEVWFQAIPRFSSEERPPLRNLRREGLVVHVETAGEFSTRLAEITRWGDDANIGPWREVSALYIPGLTGFIPQATDAYVH